MLTIGIAVRNQVTYVRRCVRNVVRCARLPTEIILVDDASEEPTAGYLDEVVRSSDGATLLRNQSRQGFAHNANLILDAAKGDPIVLLNSDTVVTRGWDRRLAVALERYEGAGVAGPSTSCSHTPQMLFDYRFGRLDATGSDIEAFATEVAERFGDTVAELPHIGGFCYGLSRRAIKDVGYFDERFGLGPCEEDDYSDRARQRGYRCLWVQGAYVHHFGGRSFAGDFGEGFGEHFESARRFYQAKRAGTCEEDWTRRPGGLRESVPTTGAAKLRAASTHKGGT